MGPGVWAPADLSRCEGWSPALSLQGRLLPLWPWKHMKCQWPLCGAPGGRNGSRSLPGLPGHALRARLLGTEAGLPGVGPGHVQKELSTDFPLTGVGQPGQ